MKKGVLLIAIVFLIIGFCSGLIFVSITKLSKGGINKNLYPETIKINVPQEELGSTIITQSDCLDYAISDWKNFSFQINSSTDCRISYVRFYKNDPIELQCTCY